ncbi:hypothetical protein PCE1_000530 [Barthelona sp. PCE]
MLGFEVCANICVCFLLVFLTIASVATIELPFIVLLCLTIVCIFPCVFAVLGWLKKKSEPSIRKAYFFTMLSIDLVSYLCFVLCFFLQSIIWGLLGMVLSSISLYTIPTASHDVIYERKNLMDLLTRLTSSSCSVTINSTGEKRFLSFTAKYWADVSEIPELPSDRDYCICLGIQAVPYDDKTSDEYVTAIDTFKTSCSLMDQDVSFSEEIWFTEKFNGTLTGKPVPKRFCFLRKRKDILSIGRFISILLFPLKSFDYIIKYAFNDSVVLEYKKIFSRHVELVTDKSAFKKTQENCNLSVTVENSIDILKSVSLHGD